jgi:hypothetical protein
MLPSITPHLQWARGGQATILSIERDRIVLRSSVPSPPGSRIEGALVGPSQALLRVKISACRRQPEGDFVLEARLIDTRQEVRQILRAIVHDRPGTTVD